MQELVCYNGETSVTGNTINLICFAFFDYIYLKSKYQHLPI
ncbi:hypothetical protein D1BOALGB6SA_8737 [Olavius sp. associated proteobacterium Delta 1]|nr:hypothetical protein D1BOALGB6SA_8737 [Olavius sp. associated proteobacterium Delta 1]